MPLAFAAHSVYMITRFFPYTIFPGGGKKGVAIRPSPSPGPLPFIPNAFYMCEALAGFDSCWASSPTRESELGKASLFPKKYLRPTQSLFSASRPNTNQMPSGITTIHPFREGCASPKQKNTIVRAYPQAKKEKLFFTQLLFLLIPP